LLFHLIPHQDRPLQDDKENKMGARNWPRYPWRTTPMDAKPAG